MGYLSISDLTTLFLAIAVLLGFARILGEVARKLHQPAIVGEIMAGIILGPTILGGMFPELMHGLFPLPDRIDLAIGDVHPVAWAFDGLITLSIVLFLMVAGMEVDLNIAIQQGRSALAVALVGIAFPFAIGFAAAWYSPFLFGYDPGSGEEPVSRLIFALFFATALSITALPVIVKILMDLNLFKTDMGMIVVTSAIINDLVGWMIFAIILSMIGAEKGLPVQYTIVLAVAFTVFVLTVGRWLVHRCLPFLQAHTSWPTGVLAFAIVMALLCATATEWMGIHAIFGSFLFGIALGDSRYLRERTRTTIEQFISSIFAPLFFASIGLHVNFIANFNFLLVVAVLIIATIGKVIGCGLVANWVGMNKREAWAIGFGMNARGAMEIILGLLALQFGVIGEELFVALVIMALVTSMTSGGIMSRILKRGKAIHFTQFLGKNLWKSPVIATEREDAIRELVDISARHANVSPGVITEAVLRREAVIPTGIGKGIAIPHARIENLPSPVIALGISPKGVDFDAPDGLPAHVIFLILTPKRDDGAQLQILSSISRLAQRKDFVDQLSNAENFTVMLAHIRAMEQEPTH
ncbi:MAG: cation:proton antiporter [Candidatus Sumerlaeia bacterium]|nr:cation:proton antiporter [Candidatus Sumerlaeia bacterium]